MGRLKHWLQIRRLLKLLHRQRESILFGLEVPSCRRCRLLKKCGLRRKNMMSLVHQLCTENALRYFVEDIFFLFFVFERFIVYIFALDFSIFFDLNYLFFANYVY